MGPAGIFGPSCECCAQLAAEEVNAGSGVLGKEMRLTLVDGGGSPSEVADEVDALVTAGSVDAVAGLAHLRRPRGGRPAHQRQGALHLHRALRGW